VESFGSSNFLGEKTQQRITNLLRGKAAASHERRRDAYVCHVLSVRFIGLQDLSRNTGEHTETGRRERATMEEQGGGEAR